MARKRSRFFGGIFFYSSLLHYLRSARKMEVRNTRGFTNNWIRGAKK